MTFQTIMTDVEIGDFTASETAVEVQFRIGHENGPEHYGPTVEDFEVMSLMLGDMPLDHHALIRHMGKSDFARLEDALRTQIVEQLDAGDYSIAAE